MMVPDRRTLIVLASLVGAMTIASGLLLVLEPAPTRTVTQMSLSSVDRPSRVGAGLFRVHRRAQEGRWSTVVIHDDAKAARSLGGLRGADSGYHFVVRAGDLSWEDRLVVSDRWQRQLEGAYWAGPESHWVNHHGIGICLERDPAGDGPSESQLQTLTWLVQRLQAEFHIAADRVILQVDSIPSQAQGRLFPVAWFRGQLLTLATP